MHMRQLVPVACGLALLSITAVVAGSPPKIEKASECPTPDAAKCVSEGYIESICGRRHQSVCEPHVTAAMEAHYLATTAPTVSMVAPKKHELPGDLKQGKYFAYAPKKTIGTVQKDVGKVYRKLGDPILPYVGMSRSSAPPVDRVSSVSPATAANHHREPSWDANGDVVESCAEYAYERSYDVVRFIDAASACRGDRECVFDVAYMNNTPGIAKRKLVDTSGAELPKLNLAKGTFPKNDLFAFGSAFVRSNGRTPLTATQSMIDLETALLEGQKWYQIGSCTNKCNTRKFADEWGWHEHLHHATAQVTEAELEEYEARKARFRMLIEQWSAAVDKEHAMLMQETVQEIVLPFDMRAHDPFERYEIEHEFIEHGVDQLQKVQTRFGDDLRDMNLQDAMQHVVGMQTGVPAVATGMLASPAPQPKSSTKPKAKSGTTQPSKQPNSKVSNCLRADGWGLEMYQQGKISCQIGEFLRSEWARKEAGHRSCLDLGNPGCDWTLAMFQASVLDQIPLLDRQLADERYCKAWQDGVTFPANSVTKARDRLKANEEQFKETWPLVKEYDRGTTSNGRRFGKDWTGGDYLGDKDWFAAGYDFDVGWDVASLDKDSNEVVCELGGSLHANTGFDAWILGGKVEVVDGAVRAEANQGGNGQVRYNAHLEMFDQSLFSTEDEPNDWKVAQTFSSDPANGFGVSLPKPKPRFDIYVGVPISGELWGELLFGSTVGMSGKASSSCNASNPTFALRGGYMPFFGAYGIGQVGVGISGIVSAGIRATLTLITVGMPLEVGMEVKKKQSKQVLSFDSQVSLMLSTLSGRVSLYIEFLLYDEEWELFRWNGIGPLQAKLMAPLSVDVPLAGMK